MKNQLLLIFTILLITSCNSNKLIGKWEEKEYHRVKYVFDKNQNVTAHKVIDGKNKHMNHQFPQV